MLRRHVRRVIQIRNRPCHTQKPVMGPGRKIHAAHGHFERSFASFVQCADRSQLRWRYLRVVEAAVALHLAGGFDAGPNLGGRRTDGLAAQVLVSNGRNLDVKVDPVE
jgi:hypothetical protein